MKRYDESVEMYNNLIRSEPYDGTVYYNRAMTFEKLQKYDEALDDYDRCVSSELSQNFLFLTIF